MASGPGRLRVALTVVLVASAVLFALGAGAERSHEHPGTTEVSTTINAEAGEPSRVSVSEHPGAETEKLFGIRTESVATTAVVVVLLLLAAGASLLSREAALLIVIVAFVAALALLDVREAFHQHRESRSGLVLVATILAIAHAGAGALALAVLAGRSHLAEAAG